MEIQVCKTPMDFPTQVGQLRDANALLDSPAALRARMAEDGYLLIRGFHPRGTVETAREHILAQLQASQAAANGARRQMPDVATDPPVAAVLESPRLFAFFERYFGEPALTFEFKWLRAVAPGQFTGLHYDNVYMGRGSDRLHTVWTPFGDLSMQLGTLAICVGSHLEPFRRLQETYGRIDVDRDKLKGAGWYSNDPLEATAKYGGEWKTTDVQMGDIIIIGMFTLHASTLNVTDRIRLSADVRYQPASDPVDDRWYGPNRTGHTADGARAPDARLFQEVKEEWGI